MADDVNEGPVTVKTMARDYVPVVVAMEDYCCAVHREQVSAHRQSHRLHNQKCFAAELSAAVGWTTEYKGGASGLDVLVDLALRSIRRSGWISLKREDLVAGVRDIANISFDELVRIEQWLVTNSSLHEEKAVFAQRRYQKDHFVACIVKCIDSLKPDFFDSYTVA